MNKWGIQNWFAQHCNGVWEHAEGIQIFTLDNPGWSIFIDLEGTILAEKDFEPISIERSESNWIDCKMAGTTFKGYGGVQNLNELLIVFKNWVESLEYRQEE